MQRGVLKLSMILVGLSFLVGCGDVDSHEVLEEKGNSNKVYRLSAEEGANHYLFYGETNHKVLGGLKNVTVIDSSDPKGVVVSNDDTGDVNYPVSSTTMQYDSARGSYGNLHVDYLQYVSDGKAYVVSMTKGASQPVAMQNSSSTSLSKPSYAKINYLGTKQYLIAHDDDSNKSVLITPDMTSEQAPIDFGDRKFLTVTYPSYGAAVDGYLVYDNEAKMVQQCSLDMTQCRDMLAVGSRDFKGDLAGTIYSAFLSDGVLYKLNKVDGSSEEISLEGKEIASGHGTTSFKGSSFYFIAKDGNLYRVDMMAKKVIKITPKKDSRIERIRAFTNDWVIYGSDTILMAAKKDGSTKKPYVLVETTKNKGYKYVTNYGVGDDFLFVPYSVDAKTGETSYRACIFSGKAPECRVNSFWAGATAAKSGEVNFESSFGYTPFAYIRVDGTDSFGGGTLKAIDPKHPLDDGISMGKAPEYNFQTFLTNSRYFDQTIESDGGVVLFAKNDTNFHVDAFYMNLFKENSLVQLTDTDPQPDVVSGRDHCHGRHCMICHNLAGGKIYQDIEGSKAAYGYKVRLDFEDGRTLLADVAKGKGENFSLPIKKLNGYFRANVVDKNGKVVNRSAGFYHNGYLYANCNLCHARDGATRYDAPGAIHIKK